MAARDGNARTGLDHTRTHVQRRMLEDALEQARRDDDRALTHLDDGTGRRYKTMSGNVRRGKAVTAV